MTKRVSLTLMLTLMLLAIGTFGWSLLFAGDSQPAQVNENDVRVQEQTATSVASAPAAGEQIKWQVVSAWGSQGGNSSYKIYGTANQTATGSGGNSSYNLNQGYWSFGGGPIPCAGCGDADHSGVVDISDAVFLIQFIFSGGPAPDDCNYQYGYGDADGSGATDISDAVYLIQYIFAGGPTPHCA